MNIEQLDLNLLPVLQAVLAERSATRAAKRLHVTQSAVSNALARLRQALGDPLLVRSARGLVPTPRALALQPGLEQIMRSLSTLVSEREAFDPATTTREFTIACADYCTTIVGARLVQRLRERAPAARLRFVPLEHLAGSDGLASNVDLHLGMPPKVPSGCRSVTLFEDRFVCMLEAGKAPKKLTLKDYLKAKHIRVSVLGSASDPVDRLLAKRRLSRDIALTVPHFSVVPMMVEHGAYIATLSSRLAEAQARLFEVKLCEPPFSLGTRSTRMIWHERSEADPAAQFFRELVRDAAGK